MHAPARRLASRLHEFRVQGLVGLFEIFGFIAWFRCCKSRVRYVAAAGATCLLPMRVDMAVIGELNTILSVAAGSSLELVPLRISVLPLDVAGKGGTCPRCRLAVPHLACSLHPNP